MTANTKAPKANPSGAAKADTPADAAAAPAAPSKPNADMPAVAVAAPASRPKAGNGADDDASNGAAAGTEAGGNRKARAKSNAKTKSRAVTPQPEGWGLGGWATDLLAELPPNVADEDAIRLKSQVETLDRPTAPSAAAPPDPTKPTIVRTQAA